MPMGRARTRAMNAIKARRSAESSLTRHENECRAGRSTAGVFAEAEDGCEKKQDESGEMVAEHSDRQWNRSSVSSDKADAFFPFAHLPSARRVAACLGASATLISLLCAAEVTLHPDAFSPKLVWFFGLQVTLLLAGMLALWRRSASMMALCSRAIRAHALGQIGVSLEAFTSLSRTAIYHHAQHGHGRAALRALQPRALTRAAVAVASHASDAHEHARDTQVGNLSNRALHLVAFVAQAMLPILLGVCLQYYAGRSLGVLSNVARGEGAWPTTCSESKPKGSQAEKVKSTGSKLRHTPSLSIAIDGPSRRSTHDWSAKPSPNPTANVSTSPTSPSTGLHLLLGSPFAMPLSTSPHESPSLMTACASSPPPPPPTMMNLPASPQTFRLPAAAASVPSPPPKQQQPYQPQHPLRRTRAHTKSASTSFIVTNALPMPLETDPPVLPRVQPVVAVAAAADEDKKHA